MKRTVATFLSLLIINHVQAQVDSIWNDQYRTVVEFKKTSMSKTGQLYQVLDSSIVLMKKRMMLKETDASQYDMLKFKVSDIDEIIIYNNKRTGKGALNGFLVGACTGVMIGFVSGTDEQKFISLSAGEKAAGLGLGLGLVGGLIGAIAGSSAEVALTINGDQKTYSKCRRIFDKYTIVK